MHHLHIALNVADLERSGAFYETVFGVPPDKKAPGYLRFTLNDPALVLTLNTKKVVRGGERLSHLGFRLGSTRALEDFRQRLSAAGLIHKEEEKVLCCHAVQDKVWVVDPEGNYWEFYELIEDREPQPSSAAPCC